MNYPFIGHAHTVAQIGLVQVLCVMEFSEHWASNVGTFRMARIVSLAAWLLGDQSEIAGKKADQK